MILQMTRPVQAGLREERKFETISNHIANADTTGFKGDVLSFYGWVWEIAHAPLKTV